MLWKPSTRPAIKYLQLEHYQPIVSDVLLAAAFDPRTLPLGAKISLRLNGHQTEYTATVSNGDKLELVIT